MNGATSGGTKKRSAVYEQYLNLKRAASPPPTSHASGPITPAMQEIANSTDEKELEAGEVVCDPACDENQDRNAGHSKQQQQQQPESETDHAPRKLQQQSPPPLDKPQEQQQPPLSPPAQSASSRPPPPVATAAAAALNDRSDAAATAAAPVSPTSARVDSLTVADALDASTAHAPATCDAVPTSDAPTTAPASAAANDDDQMSAIRTGVNRPDGPPRDRSPHRMHDGDAPRHDGPFHSHNGSRRDGSPRRNGPPPNCPPTPNGRGRSRSRSPPRGHGPPFRGPQPGIPQGRRSPPPSKFDPTPANFGHRPLSPQRFGGPGGRRSPSPGRRGGGNFGPRGSSPGRGPPGAPGDFRGRSRSPPRHNMGPPPPGSFRRSRSRSPPRHNIGPPPPGNFRRSRNRSLPRNGPGPGFRSHSPGRVRSPQRFGGHGPIGRPMSPPRGRPGSPGRFVGPGPNRGPGSPGRFGGRPGSPGRFNGSGPNGRPGSPQRWGGPPPNHFDNRGPPQYGGPFPPRGRSRSRSPPRFPEGGDMRKRDRSWERNAPPGMAMMPPHQPSVVYPMGDWAVELKRSGKFKCRCRGAATGLPATTQLPLALDVVQLPHLDKYPEFLMLSKRDLRRSVYELLPESDADRRGYDEFREYLLHGRTVPRAGMAAEMDAFGYKVFILPPGIAARALGYKGGQMVAVIRKRG